MKQQMKFKKKGKAVSPIKVHVVADETKGEVTTPSPDHEDWKAQDDFQTLTRAHGIMHDTERMAKVHAHAAKQKKIISSIADLRAMKSQMPDENPENPADDMSEMDTMMEIAQGKHGAPRMDKSEMAWAGLDPDHEEKPAPKKDNTFKKLAKKNRGY